VKWLRTQLQHTPLFPHGSHVQVQNSRFRAELRAHDFAAWSARPIVAGSGSASRMQADTEPRAACGYVYSQHIPRLAQSSDVHGHIWMLMS